MSRSRVFLQADKDWRERQLDRQPLCERCLERGRTVAAREVDHIVPLHLGGARYDDANASSLCTPCHSEKSARESAQRRGRLGHTVDGVPLARLGVGAASK